MKIKYVDIKNSSIKSGRTSKKITLANFNNFISSVDNDTSKSQRRFFLSKEQELQIEDGILGYDMDESYILYKFGSKRVSQRPMFSAGSIGNYYNLFFPDLYFVYFIRKKDLLFIYDENNCVPMTNLYGFSKINDLSISNEGKRNIELLTGCNKGRFFCLGDSLSYILPEILKAASSRDQQMKNISNNIELIINTVISSKGNDDLSIRDKYFNNLINGLSKNDRSLRKRIHLALKIYTVLSRNMNSYNEVFSNIYSLPPSRLIEIYNSMVSGREKV